MSAPEHEDDGRYQWQPGMGEISGFGKEGSEGGKGYEACCVAMVRAGLRWWDAHPTADPKFHGFKDIYGILMEDNQDAKDISAAMVEAGRSHGGSTGAQHQACIGHIFLIRKLGWEKYVDESKRREAAEALERAGP